MEWLADNGWLVWVAIALVLAGVEAMTVDFVFVMLAGGALAGAVAAGVGASLPIQVISAVVVALGLIFVVRPIAKRRFEDTETDHHIGASALVGQQAWVLETVSEHDGRIKLSGETWSARVADGARPIEPGLEVRVLAVQGAVAIVAQQPNPQIPPPPT